MIIPFGFVLASVGNKDVSDRSPGSMDFSPCRSVFSQETRAEAHATGTFVEPVNKGCIPVKVVPVLDILGGQVVRGVAGRRTEYRPIVSCLTSSTDPLEVARAIRNSFGLSEFYVADLDGILSGEPNLTTYCRLLADGFELLVDTGTRTAMDARILSEVGVSQLIVGLETCSSPEVLASIFETTPNVIFSLDLDAGLPRYSVGMSGWSSQPTKMVRQAVAANASAILVLDLSDVGMGTGGSTDGLCHFVRTEFPALRLITGGGVRSRDDLIRISSLGVDSVLVASALHDGRLSRSDVLANRDSEV